MPVSTRVCLKPPPAETMSRMPAIGGSDCSIDSLISLAAHAGAAAEGEHRDEDGDQQRDERGAEEVEDLLHAAVPSSTKMSASALPSISTTGSSTVASGDAEAGRVAAAVRRSPARLEQVGRGDVDPAAGVPAEQRARR